MSSLVVEVLCFLHIDIVAFHSTLPLTSIDDWGWTLVLMQLYVVAVVVVGVVVCDHWSVASAVWQVFHQVVLAIERRFPTLATCWCWLVLIVHLHVMDQDSLMQIEPSTYSGHKEEQNNVCYVCVCVCVLARACACACACACVCACACDLIWTTVWSLFANYLSKLIYLIICIYK